MKLYITLMLSTLALVATSCNKGEKQIIENAEKASFTIYTYDEFGLPLGSGSGFFIDESGIGITNYHVLDQITKAIILTSDKSKFEIESIVAADPNLDIIKFKVRNPRAILFDFLQFENSLPDKGDKVFCISSPDGLTNSFSEGVVSSIRENSIEGKVIQFTAPISPGSSGSAILNHNGNIIAITKYKRTGEYNENLNFGIYADEDLINSINRDLFSKHNPKFSKRNNFFILNKKSDNSPHDILNAIEFSENGTTLYMSFTNSYLLEDPDAVWGVYQDINRDENTSMYLEDLTSGTKYYLISSSLGDKNNMTRVPLGTTIRYKQYFPKILGIPNNISVREPDTRSAQWSNISLSDKYELSYFNDDDFLFIDALKSIKRGDILESINLLNELVGYDPSNVEALSMLGVLSYSIENNSEALNYFDRVIELSPSSPVHYSNRHIIHKKINNIEAALNDISKAISLAPDQPEFYESRELIYLLMNENEKAMNDFFKRDEIEAKDQKRPPITQSGVAKEKIYKKVLSQRKNIL
jgi:serine protease Do